MCGRTAQTVQAVRLAASMLQVDLTNLPPAQRQQLNDESKNNNNYNLSPGMDAWVFTLDENNNNNGSTPPRLRLERKVWGLVTRGGTVDRPVEPGMGKHFSNLMFNARADTLYEKPTFLRLLRSNRACLIAVDGFYEWKTETGGIKQPYFVTAAAAGAVAAVAPGPNDSTAVADDASSSSFLLLAGLWTSVATGHQGSATDVNGPSSSSMAERLDTFTIITTEACESLRWLHSRMPVAVHDASWLCHCQEERFLSTSVVIETSFRWHAVTRDMTSMKFRSAAALVPLPKLKTVKSMFAAVATTKAKAPSPSAKAGQKAASATGTAPLVDSSPAPSSSKKRAATTTTTPSPQKQQKRGMKSVGDHDDDRKKKANGKTIDSFFQRKPTAQNGNQ